MNTNSSTGAKLSVNVGKVERVASVAAGAALLFKGLQNEEKTSGIAMAIAGGFLLFRGATGHCKVYSLAGKKNLPDTVKNINIMTKLTVNVPRQQVYDFWRELSNLPLFMQHLERVDEIDNKRSHWVAKPAAHLGKIEWDAEIVKEINGELLSWNSLPHASVNNAGKVEFRDADEHGTEMTVLITYRAPFGDVGEGIASMLNPVFKKMITNDIKNFKHYMEAGDILKKD